MRSTAIEKIISYLESYLESKDMPLSSMIALDFFAREGDWQTFYYAQKVLCVHAWEIDPKFEANLRKNLPSNSQITIGDSFEIIKNNSQKFDMVVLDNPQGCFGQNKCEHFDALPLILDHVSNDCIIIFNVKTEPFDYEDKIEWKKRRNEFYGIEASNLKKDFIFKFYKEFFKIRGFDTIFSFLEPRPQEDHLYSFAVILKREQHD